MEVVKYMLGRDEKVGETRTTIGLNKMPRIESIKLQ